MSVNHSVSSARHEPIARPSLSDMAKFQKLKSRRNKHARTASTPTPQVQPEIEDICSTSDSETEGYYIPTLRPVPEVDSVVNWDVTPTPTDEVCRYDYYLTIHPTDIAPFSSLKLHNQSPNIRALRRAWNRGSRPLSTVSWRNPSRCQASRT